MSTAPRATTSSAVVASEVKHVEVKGTTTDGAEVILTPNEVRHARENPCTALFVLSNITVERAEDGAVTATGGTHHATTHGTGRRNTDTCRLPLSGTCRRPKVDT